MLFFTKLYDSRSTTPYEKALNEKVLNRSVLEWPENQYKELLSLKDQANMMAASMHELRCVTDRHLPAGLNELEKNLSQVLYNIILNNMAGSPGDPRADVLKCQINNQFNLLKNSLQERATRNKFSSSVNVLSNSLVALAGAICFGAGCMMLSTGPIGSALLGLGVAILTGFIVEAAIYSIYIDARFLAGKQLEEINGLVKLLWPNAEEEQLRVGLAV